jgi:hypothetical protein
LICVAWCPSKAYGETARAILQQRGVLTAFLDLASGTKKRDVPWSLVPHKLYHLGNAESVPDIVKTLFKGQFRLVIRHFHRFVVSVANYDKDLGRRVGNVEPIAANTGNGSELDSSEDSGPDSDCEDCDPDNIYGDLNGTSIYSDLDGGGTDGSNSGGECGNDENDNQEEAPRRQSARIAQKNQKGKEKEEEEEEEEEVEEDDRSEADRKIAIAEMHLKQLHNSQTKKEERGNRWQDEWAIARGCLFPEIPFVGLGLSKLKGKEYGLELPSTIRIIANLLRLISKIDTRSDITGYLFLFFNLFHIDPRYDTGCKVGLDKISDILVCLLLPLLLRYTEAVAKELEPHLKGTTCECRLFTWPQIHKLVQAWSTRDCTNFDYFDLNGPLWSFKQLSFKKEGYLLPCLPRPSGGPYPRIFVPLALAARIPRTRATQWTFGNMWHNAIARQHFSSFLKLDGVVGRSDIEAFIKQLNSVCHLILSMPW